METAHVLIADITGSTQLYDRLSDRDALTQINKILAGMRHIIEENGGHCVKSQGDDTLSFFSDADHVFKAARAMIETRWDSGLDVHAGISWGEVLKQDADIYGDAVNTAARLASLAKPGEVMIGDTVFEKLSEGNQEQCVAMGGIKLKGKARPTKVHSLSIGELTSQTVLFEVTDVPRRPRTESVSLECNGAQWTLQDGDTLMVGRGAGCNAMLDHPWVSRMHGSFEVRGAQLEYSDHSSSGSTVITSGGQEFPLQRRSMLLSGEGIVLIGTRDPEVQSSIIRYATNDLVPD